MLQIACEECGRRFWVDGYTTPDSFTEPGEVVTDLEPVDEDDALCLCLQDGSEFSVVAEEHPTFDDDVI